MPIDKRVKRHILSRPASFFAATAPGIEDLCRSELLALGFAAEDIRVENGGVAFSGRVHDGFRANLFLRTANRILMRMTAFSATDFRRLEKHAAGLPWELYLRLDAGCRISVTSRKSRLFHSNAVAERLQAAIEERRRFLGIASSSEHQGGDQPQRIFARVENDRCVISIDSSGELLYKRGLKSHAAGAPIRETIAAAVLLSAGYRSGDPLIDPMCGSGTFSIEAAMMGSRIPAGWYRRFAFMAWPCFRETQWRHIRRQAALDVRIAEQPFVFASDIDADACLHLEDTILAHETAGAVTVSTRNFFDLKPSDFPIPDARRLDALMVINPPYGRRMALESSDRQFFAAIARKLSADFKGWKVALIIPDRHLLTHAPPGLRFRSFFHGGLRPSLLTGRID
jgi:putative N6-adenine-specific DNA methylase